MRPGGRRIPDGEKQLAALTGLDSQIVFAALKITPQTWIFVRDRKCLTTGNISSLSETAY